MQERKRRRFEQDWEGSKEDLQSRILNADSFITANLRLVLIRNIRHDLGADFKKLLELHMRLKFEQSDGLSVFLTDCSNDDRDFMKKVVEMITDECKAKEYKNVAYFNDAFVHQYKDQQTTLFTTAATSHPDRACDYLLALLAIRPDCFNSVSKLLVDRLRDPNTLPEGIVHIGKLLVDVNFGNLLPDDIICVLDAVLRSTQREDTSPQSKKKDVNDPKEKRRRCERAASRFVATTYRLFSAALAKLACNAFDFRLEKDPRLITKLVSRLPDKSTPLLQRIVAFILLYARTKVPAWTKSGHLCLWLPGFARVPERDEEKREKAAQHNQLPYHSVLTELAPLLEKVPPLSGDFSAAVALCHDDEVHSLVALALLYASRFDECANYCQQRLPSSSSDGEKASLLAVRLSAQYLSGARASAAATSLELLQVAVDREWTGESHEIATHAGRKETTRRDGEADVFVLPVESAAHFSLSLLANLLQASPDDDFALAMCIVISQVNFESVGFERVRAALSVVEEKGAFSFPSLLSFMSSSSIVKQLSALVHDKEKVAVTETQERKGLSTRKSAACAWDKTRDALLSQLVQVNKKDAVLTAAKFTIANGERLVKTF